jgi:flagellar biogenesis protein FliO
MITETDELHNKEDASSLSGSVLFFLALIFVVGLIGIIFWVAV